MTLLSVSEDITSLAAIIQAILAAATLALLVAQFSLQSGIFRMQQKITETQLKQAEIDASTYRLVALEHTHRIMPKFSATQSRCSQQMLPGGHAIFELELKFTSNLNITKELKFRVETSEDDIWSEIDQPFEKAIVHPGQHFDFRAKYKDNKQKVYAYPSNLHFVLEFKDDDLKPYIQHIYTSFGTDDYVHIRIDEPVLLKYV
ncbi:MAG TPA: hypothetical protein VHE59_01175 [Mucilaginibacter sp.]|nr:hypothetical protein [Mucilaginibacter sp.]